LCADENQTKNDSTSSPLDLTFVPDWVRKPPVSIRGRERSDAASANGGSVHPVDERDEVVERFGEIRRTRPSRPRRSEPKEERSADRRRKGAPPPRRRPGGEGEPGGESAPVAIPHERRVEGGERQRRERPVHPEEPLPPLVVTFLPERAGLHLVARRIASAGCAFPLFPIAAFFLNQPAHLSVRLSPAPAGTEVETEEDAAGGSEPSPTAEPASTPPLTLVQCQICQQVFRDRSRASAHVLERHIDRWYQRQERDVEPPTGQFSSVARCPLSGELLGPPNHHAFEERLLYLHRTRFSHLTLEEYRRRIENVRDPALIEEWRKGASRKVVYSVLAAPDQPPLESFEKVERHFQEHYLADTLKEGTTVTVPGPLARELEDAILRRVVQEAWRRETRFPLALSITLRLMFRHMGLHIFKTEDGTHYVTAIMPSPLNSEGTAPVVREILQFLSDHPRATRTDLLAALRPGVAPDDPAAHDVTTQLHWLRDKGHVIEFTGGGLLLPGPSIRRVQPARRDERREGRRSRPDRSHKGNGA